MKIESAKFVKGIRGTDPIISDFRRQYVFIGRSNVGKSSIINALAGRKDLARTSAEPGKTREANFYLANEREEADGFYIVDLPGYGYAKVRDRDKEGLIKLILWYLFESGAPIDKVFLCIDALVGPTQKDLEMKKALETGGVSFAVIANKMDKVSPSLRAKRRKELQSEIGFPVIPFSAEKKEGLADVFSEMGLPSENE